MFKEDITEDVKIFIELVETFNYKEELEKIKIYEDNEDNEDIILLMEFLKLQIITTILII